VLVVGAIGLGVNCVAFVMMRAGASESLNLRGAYLEVLSDMLGSIGVVVGAIVWGITGWEWVDPVIGVAIALFILPRAWRLGREAMRVLLQAAPAGLDLPALQTDIAAIDGVVDVHDLHVWTLTSEMEVVTAHLVVTTGTETHGVLDRARALLAEGYGITHATFQVEPDDHRGCEEMTW
jgi:cobalt-zinc-cadmium efflux system protein